MNEASWLSQNWWYQGRGSLTILSDQEFLSQFPVLPSISLNFLLFGGPTTNSAFHKIVSSLPSTINLPVSFSGSDSSFTVGPRTFSAPATGILALLPHPTNTAQNLVGIVAGVDYVGFRKAMKQFPVKSAMTIPDWLVCGPQAEWKGAGGLLGAGFWDNEWQYNALTSYLR